MTFAQAYKQYRDELAKSYKNANKPKPGNPSKHDYWRADVHINGLSNSTLCEKIAEQETQ